MGKKPDHQPISAAPLFEVIPAGHGEKSKWATKLKVSPGVLNNWKWRGIPANQVPNVALQMGISTDEYLRRAGHLPEGAGRKPATTKMLEEFADLPDGLQEHVARKITELLGYAKALPPFIRNGMQGPPKAAERYRQWEKDLEADMDRIKKKGSAV